MNQRKEKRVGIEVGSRDLHIAVYEGGQISRVYTEGLPEGLVQNGKVLSFEALSDMLKDMRRRYHIRPRDAALVLPPSVCYCRRFTTAVMSAAQLKFNLPYEFHEYISGAREDYFYDYALVSGAGEEKAEGLDLMAAAAPKKVISDYADAFHRGGILAENGHTRRAGADQSGPGRGRYCPQPLHSGSGTQRGTAVYV